MADYPSLVERIRTILQSGHRPTTGEVANLASKYAEACTQVNARLIQCHEYLQKGLRSEALHLAESAPNLLDSVATLDFAEAEAWDQLAASQRLSRAPALAGRGATELNGAYAREQPLQDLLRQHRRLALARAALPARIAVMRKIAELDPGNTMWVEDLRTFEAFRVRQIEDELAGSGDRPDPDALAGLLAELEATDWIEPPPRSLTQAVKRAKSQQTRFVARGQITPLAAELKAAHSTQDIERGRQARDAWNVQLERAALPADDPRKAQVDEALAWLDEHDRRDQDELNYQDALASLESGLAEVRVRDELERRYQDVLHFQRPLPDGLERRTKSRLSGLAQARDRRRRLIFVASSAGVLFAAGLAFTLYREHSDRRDAEAAANALNRWLDTGEIARAGQEADKLLSERPGLFQLPVLGEANARVVDAREKEKERTAKFASLMHVADSAPLGPADPDTLTKARDLARLPEEKQSVEQLGKRRGQAFLALQAKLEAAARPRLEGLRGTISELELRLKKGAPRESIESSMNQAKAVVRAIEPDMPSLSSSLQSMFRIDRARLDELANGLDERDRQAESQSTLTKTVAQVASAPSEGFSPYAKVMQSVVDRFPKSTRGVAFAEALKERPSWESVLVWKALIEAWKGPLTQLTPTAARARAAACRDFLKEHPRFPQRNELLAYQQVLEAVARREGESDSALEHLKSLFSDGLVQGVWTARTRESDGEKRYYLRTKPDLGRDSVELSYLADFRGREHSKRLPKKSVLAVELSPQAKLAESAKTLLAKDGALVQWEATMIEIAKRIQDAPGIDPILQLILIGRIVTFGQEGSVPLRLALAKQQSAIERADLQETLAWLDPDDSDAEAARPKARRVVTTLPDWPAALKAAEAERIRIEQALPTTARPVGWLARSGSGWECLGPTSELRDGPLKVLAPDHGHDTQFVWKGIGEVKGGRVILDTRDASSLLEGRPVFASP